MQPYLFTQAEKFTFYSEWLFYSMKHAAGNYGSCVHQVPCRSSRLNKSSRSKMADELTGDEKSLSTGQSGITCCFNTSFNNSRRNAQGNYIFPKKPALGEKWIEHIRRENFTRTKHPICSAHIEGENKSYVKNVATIFGDCVFELWL